MMIGAQRLMDRERSAAPLTVAIVSTQKAWHGGEAQAMLLATGLRARGHRVCILGRRGTPFPQRMAQAAFETADFAGRGRNALACWQIRQKLRSWQPDVLFYNDPHSLTAGLLASAWLDVPVRLAARRVDFRLKSAWRYRRGCDRVLCVSEAVAEVCRAGGLDDERLRVVHDGVDPARINHGDRDRGRRSLGIDAQQPLLLTVAKLTDHKGHRYLLAALPQVLARFPTAVCALAGDGELRESLEAEARRLGIADRVRFLGYRDDVADLIHAADVVVAPSHLEGLNTSIIDAMLAARPIVTTTAGGIPDLTAAREPAIGPVAWVVPPREVESLAAAIISALEDRALAATLAERARARALELFTADTMVLGTLRAIDEVLMQKRRHAA